MAAPSGTDIRAVAAGTVTMAGSSGGGLGQVVAVRHNVNGVTYTSVYGHMKSGTAYVRAGQWVGRGQHIGDVGMTGTATGYHLHLEIHRGVWRAAGAVRQDPNAFMAAYGANLAAGATSVTANSVPSSCTYYNHETLNLRSGPGTSYRSLRVMPISTTMIAKPGDGIFPWVRVTADGQTGWAHNAYLYKTWTVTGSSMVCPATVALRAGTSDSSSVVATRSQGQVLYRLRPAEGTWQYAATSTSTGAPAGYVHTSYFTKQNPILAVSVTAATASTPATATATITVNTTKTPAGTVAFTVAGRTVAAGVSGGKASVKLPVLGAGTYTVAGAYTPSGSTATYTNGSSRTATLTVTANPITAKSAVKIAGTAAVGQTLSVPAGTWSVAGVSVAYRWVRDGKDTAVTSSTYKVAAADAGSSLAVRLVASKAGYTSATLTTPAVTVAKVTPTVSATLPSSVVTTAQGKAVVSVTAATLAKPVGTLTLTVAGQSVTTTLTAAAAGKATLTLPKVTAAGPQKVSLTYTPAAAEARSTAPATWTGTLNVVLPPITANAPTAVTVVPQVGSTLTAPATTWSVPGVSVALRWLRDGTETAVTSSSYRVTAADAGSALSVRMTATKSGYATSSVTSPAVAIPRITPTLTAAAATATTVTAAKVTVRVAGATTPTPTGTLTATVGTQKVSTPLDAAGGGSATLTLPVLKAGTYPVAVTFTPSAADAKGNNAATVTTSVTVSTATFTIRSAPVVTGTPAVGQTVTAGTPTWSVPQVVTSYQWLRDGATIGGATAASYKVTAADAGRTLSVRLTGKLAGYADATALSAPVKVAKVTPTLTATLPASVASTAAASTTVAVTTATVPIPTGTVAATLNGATVKATLTAASPGKVTLTLPKVTKAGTYNVSFTYTPTAAEATSTAPVTVTKTLKVT